MPSPVAITVSQLSRLIGTPSSPLIIDLRIDEDFNVHPQCIPGAFRHSHKQLEVLVPSLESKRVVLVCHKGKKISQGAAAVLRQFGVRAEFLEGGQVAWLEAEKALVSTSTLTNRNASGQTVWVTRHRPKIDRIACPWLIRRFIDPNAQFLYVEPSEVLLVAEKFNAVAFDVEGAVYNHQEERCTFDAMLSAFSLDTEPLRQMANIIRAADTGQHELAPQASGLLAISLGLSRMYKDDLAQLEAGIPVYDALYRWCRDARSETHDGSMHARNVDGVSSE